MGGWISIHRKIQEHWLWNEKPYSRGQAWIDLLLMASHKDNKFLLGNELLEIQRGSFITSEYKLMDRWGWSKTKVRNFLKLLENEKMLTKLADKKRTTITIVNYDSYQVLETTEKPLENPINNVNKDNNNIYSANFEKMWGLYPNKKGKGQVSDSKKKEIFKVGEEFERCISRYKDYVVKERNNGFKDLKYQNGSTFFNSGYVDYLDKNYKGGTDKIKEEKRPPLKMVIRDNY